MCTCADVYICACMWLGVPAVARVGPVCPALGMPTHQLFHVHWLALHSLSQCEYLSLLRDPMAMGCGNHTNRERGWLGPRSRWHASLCILAHLTPQSLPACQEKHCRLVPREGAPCPQPPGYWNFHHAAAFRTKLCLEWGPQPL